MITADYPLTSVMLGAIKVFASTPEAIEYIATIMKAKYPTFSSQIEPLGPQLKVIEEKFRDSAERGVFKVIPPFNLENASLLVQQGQMNFQAPDTLKVEIEFDDEQRLGLKYEIDQRNLSQWAKYVGLSDTQAVQFIDTYFWLFLLENGISIQDDKLYKDGQILNQEDFKKLLSQDPSYLNYLYSFAKNKVELVVSSKASLDLSELPTKEVVKAYEEKSGVGPTKAS